MAASSPEQLELFASGRPRTRADCQGGLRPCPWASCKYHLMLELLRKDPEAEVTQMTETCALDVADRGGATLEEVGALFRVTDERIRQIQRSALRKVRAAMEEE
jgi:hypothetical protein